MRLLFLLLLVSIPLIATACCVPEYEADYLLMEQALHRFAPKLARFYPKLQKDVAEEIREKWQRTAWKNYWGANPGFVTISQIVSMPDFYSEGFHGPAMHVKSAEDWVKKELKEQFLCDAKEEVKRAQEFLDAITSI